MGMQSCELLVWRGQGREGERKAHFLGGFLANSRPNSQHFSTECCREITEQKKCHYSQGKSAFLHTTTETFCHSNAASLFIKEPKNLFVTKCLCI